MSATPPVSLDSLHRKRRPGGVHREWEEERRDTQDNRAGREEREMSGYVSEEKQEMETDGENNKVREKKISFPLR